MKKNQIKIFLQFCNKNNIILDVLPKIGYDAYYLNNGNFTNDKPNYYDFNNTTKSLDLRIRKNDNSDILYNNIRTIFIALKITNKDGGHQTNVSHEIKNLARHSPNTNDEEQLIFIMDGTYNYKEKLINAVNVFSKKEKRNCKMFNSTENYLKYLKKLLIK